MQAGGGDRRIDLILDLAVCCVRLIGSQHARQSACDCGRACVEAGDALEIHRPKDRRAAGAISEIDPIAGKNAKEFRDQEGNAWTATKRLERRIELNTMQLDKIAGSDERQQRHLRESALPRGNQCPLLLGTTSTINPLLLGAIKTD